MKIIAHRGAWTTSDEKNTLCSLTSAINNGYGIETDLRDYNEKLVVSHDVPTIHSQEFEEFLKYYKESKSNQILALNVKSDGIQKLLIPLLEKYNIQNYFLFDMSIPEFVVNVKLKLKNFTRNSDIEKECIFYDISEGVWLDSFYDENWITIEHINNHLKHGKRVCIVSPELHGWNNAKLWKILKENIDDLNENIYLCTDYPDKAREYFYGE